MPNFPKKTNWWLMILPTNVGVNGTNFNVLNATLITSNVLPEGDITINKTSEFAEYKVAGLDYVPTNFVLNTNASFSVRLPIVNKKDKQFGNTNQIMQFERLRTQQVNIVGNNTQWNNNPVVIWYGYTNRPPLPCLVRDVKITHLRDHLIPKYGTSSFSYVELTLQYIENTNLYKMWKYVQLAGSQIGMIQNLQKGNLLY